MRFSRDWAGEYGLTPARIDMLIAIYRDDAGIAQSALRDTLDVCDAVVSRMLSSLAERGQVQSWEHPLDGRMRWITLTDRARRVLRNVIEDLFHEGFIEAYVRVIVAPHATRNRDTERALRRLREILRTQRPHLTDVATLTYPAYMADGSRSPDYPVSTVRRRSPRAASSAAPPDPPPHAGGRPRAPAPSAPS